MSKVTIDEARAAMNLSERDVLAISDLKMKALEDIKRIVLRTSELYAEVTPDAKVQLACILALLSDNILAQAGALARIMSTTTTGEHYRDISRSEALLLVRQLGVNRGKFQRNEVIEQALDAARNDERRLRS